MDKKALLSALEEILSIAHGTLKSDSLLSAFADWDSMAFLGVVSLMDLQFHKKISLETINSFKTPQDIFNFIGMT